MSVAASMFVLFYVTRYEGVLTYHHHNARVHDGNISVEIVELAFLFVYTFS